MTYDSDEERNVNHILVVQTKYDYWEDTQALNLQSAIRICAQEVNQLN